MMKTLLLLSFAWILWTRETLPDPSTGTYYISSSSISALRKPAKECTYRYKPESIFGKPDNQNQQQLVTN